jgi:hypothetical protein
MAAKHGITFFYTGLWLDRYNADIFTSSFDSKTKWAGKLSKRDGQKFGFPVFPIAGIPNTLKNPLKVLTAMDLSPEPLSIFWHSWGGIPGQSRNIFIATTH